MKNKRIAECRESIIVELFDFGFHSACIYKHWFNEEGFHPFFGGCGIGPETKTIEEARAKIFEYVKMEIARRIASANQKITDLQKVDSKLASDSFNLGRFKVTPK